MALNTLLKFTGDLMVSESVEAGEILTCQCIVKITPDNQLCVDMTLLKTTKPITLVSMESNQGVNDDTHLRESNEGIEMNLRMNMETEDEIGSWNTSSVTDMRSMFQDAAEEKEKERETEDEMRTKKKKAWRCELQSQSKKAKWTILSPNSTAFAVVLSSMPSMIENKGVDKF
jgi:hypothetical protein